MPPRSKKVQALIDGYQPMRRPKDARSKWGGGAAQMGDDRVRWLDANQTKLVEYNLKDDFAQTLPEGSATRARYEAAVPERSKIRLTLSGRSATLQLDLTGFTADELTVIREFIVGTIDKAIPLARARDVAAEEVFDECNDDSHPRLYRGVPSITHRKVHVAQHDQGVHERPEPGAGLDDEPAGDDGHGDGSGPVAERDAGRGEAEDDAPEAGEPASVRQVEWQPPVPPRLPDSFTR